MKKSALFVFVCLIAAVTEAQVLTKEDSLAAGLKVSNKTTVLSGYGEIMTSYNTGTQTGSANLTRFVTFFGHRFSKNIALFSELELENAKVTSSGGSGEFSLEQAFIKFDLNRSNYIVAGLFIPRIGIINENHLPTTYNGNNRHFLETNMIPATWREIGVGFYGRFDRLPGFNYYMGITNGLSSAGFARTTGIKDGRYEGSNASSGNIALSAAALYYYRNFRIQASGYYGGTAGLTPKTADSLKLNSGLFGTPVALGEFNVQYTGKRIGFKGLAAVVSSPDAYAINRAYAQNTPKQMKGAFAEVSYELLNTKNFEDKKLYVFYRYEAYDLNASMPSDALRDWSLNQQFSVVGLTYKPHPGVAIKFDVVNKVTGTPNQAFTVTPTLQTPAYLTNNWFVNLGLGYNF